MKNVKPKVIKKKPGKKPQKKSQKKASNDESEESVTSEESERDERALGGESNTNNQAAYDRLFEIFYFETRTSGNSR